MKPDPALFSMARLVWHGTFRTDPASCRPALALPAFGARVALLALCVVFVVVGATDLDLGPQDARLGLAAGERLGPLGQVFGYWAPDVWPAQVLPSFLFAQLEPGGRPGSAAVRWPAALAAIILGWMLAQRMAKALGTRAGLLFGVCWFGSMGLIDRSGASGLDLILGLGTVAAIDRVMNRGSDWVAGLWASLAFLSGGWPPLAVIGLAIVVLGRTTARFSIRLVIPPLLTIAFWSVETVRASSAEVWAAALTLPLTQKPSWSLALEVLALGLPWSLFALLALGRSLRASWSPEGKSWLYGWLQVALGSLIAGTIVPGLSQPARVVALAGVTIAAAAGLESAWTKTLTRATGRAFFGLFSCVVAVWLSVILYGTYICTLCLPYYRTIGVFMALLVIVVAFLSWWSLVGRDSRLALITVLLVAFGLKLVYWGYYAPEWNYRNSQGPWARAIAQWMPRTWTLYTLHEWPADLAFFTKRTVRQLSSPEHLKYQKGIYSKYILLLPSEFENWPQTAPPISFVARFQDKWSGERILARSPGILPPPLGPNPARLSLHSGPRNRRSGIGSRQTPTGPDPANSSPDVKQTAAGRSTLQR
jgi:hypothetical protein